MRKIDYTIYNFLINNGVLNIPELNDEMIRNWGFDIHNVYEHYDSYLLNIQNPNSPGPIEKHPYIDLYNVDCDFQRSTLLLGTFPPSSYFNNLNLNNLPNPNIQNNNPLHFYYGNMNSLWRYLFPNLINTTIPNIQEQLRIHSISISDVFAYVQRKTMISSSDSDLRNIVLNCNLSHIFNSDSTISTLLFTSGKLESFLSNTVSTLTGFRWILEDCCGGLDEFKLSGDITGDGEYFPINNAGVKIAVQQQNGGIIWWLKSKKKSIRIVNLPSPAGSAAIRIIGSSFFLKWLNFKANQIGLPQVQVGENIQQYLALNPGLIGNPKPTVQYRQEVYEMVLNNTIHNI